MLKIGLIKIQDASQGIFQADNCEKSVYEIVREN